MPENPTEEEFNREEKRIRQIIVELTNGAVYETADWNTLFAALSKTATTVSLKLLLALTPLIPEIESFALLNTLSPAFIVL